MSSPNQIIRDYLRGGHGACGAHIDLESRTRLHSDAEWTMPQAHWFAVQAYYIGGVLGDSSAILGRQLEKPESPVASCPSLAARGSRSRVTAVGHMESCGRAEWLGPQRR